MPQLKDIGPIQDLLYSLASVLIAYHDTQLKSKHRLVQETDEIKKKDQTRQLAKTECNKDGYLSFFEKIIKETCPQNYEERLPFLYYILHHIKELKSISNKELPLVDGEDKILLLNIHMFITELDKLTKTLKGDYAKVHQFGFTQKINQNTKVIELLGQTNGIVRGYNYCTSGVKVRNEVFEHLNLDTPEKILHFAYDVVMGPQNTLKSSEISKLKEQNKEKDLSLSTQESEKNELREEVKQLKTEITKLQEQIRCLEEQSKKAVVLGEFERVVNVKKYPAVLFGDSVTPKKISDDSKSTLNQKK